MKHNRKFVIHSDLTPEEERQEDTETNEETSEGIRNKKSHAVISFYEDETWCYY